MPPVSAGACRNRPSTGPKLIANKDKEIARLEAAYTTNVEKSGARVLKTRAVLEDAHTVRLATGEARARQICADRNRRRAEPRRRHSRHRARDLLERGVSTCRSCRGAS